MKNNRVPWTGYLILLYKDNTKPIFIEHLEGFHSDLLRRTYLAVKKKTVLFLQKAH